MRGCGSALVLLSCRPRVADFTVFGRPGSENNVKNRYNSIIRKKGMPTPTMAGRQDTVQERIEKIRQHQISGNNPDVLQDQLFLGCDGSPSPY